MELSAYSGHAVRLANTAGPQQRTSGVAPDRLLDRAAAQAAGDTLCTLDDLRALLVELPTLRRNATEADIAPLRRLRADFLLIFQDAVDGEETVAVKRLNTLLAAARMMPQITGHDGEDWHLHVAEGARTSSEGFTAASVLGLAFYIAEYGLTRLGICQSRPCHRVFIDVSTNRSRRYCSERCATRANVAAYRARKRSQIAAVG